ncbi:MAG TPA: polysaccharide deacetylase family protein [Vicinamibacterales bacterium]
MKAILTYHSVDSSGSVISVPPATFDRHVRWMASSGVAVVPLQDLLRTDVERDAIAITFDDAYTNFMEEAWPRLRDHGLPVTLFVPTAFTGKTNDWSALPGGDMPSLPILDWTRLNRLKDEGVSLGAHTRRHPDMRTLDARQLEDEVWGSVEDLHRETGTKPEAFAYPYGFCGSAGLEIVRAACACACTTELRPLRQGDDAHLLPRLDTFYLRGPAGIEHFGRRSFREYLRLRLQLRGLKQRLLTGRATNGR